MPELLKPFVILNSERQAYLGRRPRNKNRLDKIKASAKKLNHWLYLTNSNGFENEE